MLCSAYHLLQPLSPESLPSLLLFFFLQWMAEAKSKLSGNLRIHMYHGSGRIRDPHTLASNYDLVVRVTQQ